MDTKIALTNLGKYNEGKLIFTWLQLPCTDEELRAAKDEIGINEQYEEWFITDYESDIEGLKIEEYENIDDLNELLEQIENIDDDDLNAIIESTGYELQECIDIYNSGKYEFYPDCKTYADVAGHMVDNGLYGDVSESLAPYIDYESIGNDLDCDGYCETSYGVIYTG